MKQVGLRFPGRIIYTAPTNKATKVLRTSLKDDKFHPLTKTIYSLLGLRMQANGELKELVAPEDDIDLSEYALVVVDEGSMVNNILCQHIDEAKQRYPKLRFLFVGDAAQLPPVKEQDSRIWETKLRWHLDEQMRNAGPILSLAKELRKQQAQFVKKFAPASVNHENGLVSALGTADFEDWIRQSARAGEFGETNSAKIVCWRNATVDNFNRMVRQVLFDSPEIPWLSGDRIILTEPAQDFIEDKPMASTDDEGLVDRAEAMPHPLYPYIQCWRLSVTLDDNRMVVLWARHADSETAYVRKCEELSAAARQNGRKWREFWAFKEAFHSVRHAYAITAHRAQGSTYEKTFVNWRDILVNRNSTEAYKCLYVACTRPKKQLILG